ncbi:outer-membrane lipoprotein carrier protein LolA [Terrihabitans sp. B22-R8]|uniref:outer-membrane lipoprotein carrier protein LolA n=1 Tax=Terrihabitans sp. B22-R8 TaxID=3425128 RepID=UPI00403CDBE2
MILRAALPAFVLLALAMPHQARAQGVPHPVPRPAGLIAAANAPGAGAPMALTAEALAASRRAKSRSDAPMALMAQASSTAPSPRPSAQNVAASTQSSPAEAVRKVNTYFNGIRTLVGNFSQVGPDGSRTAGKFFLAKPGRIRFYYQAPSTTDIIADGKSLVVRDRKLATQDVYPLSQTPLRFLLDPNLDLVRDSKVVGVRQEGDVVSVMIEEKSTFAGKSRILLVFGASSSDPQSIELKQWTVTDPQGLDTTIFVSELDPRSRPDEKLFKVDYTRYVQ